MITLILALFGCALIMGSVFSLYRSSHANAEPDFINDTQLDIANKKIDVLTNEIEETKEQVAEAEFNPVELKQDAQGLINQNIPIIEIKDADLGEASELAEPVKKGQRILYNHQIKISIMNVGKYSLKDVIFSIKDIYNESTDKKKKKKSSNEYSYMGRTFDNEDLGAYNNIEVNTLNLKTKKLIYVSNLPSSFGVGDYYFDIIVEWSGGFYQMHVDIEELGGKLKYRYQFYDVDGHPIDFKKIQENISA